MAVSPASPTVVTTASQAITFSTGLPTLGDTAVLAGGYLPTGTIIFTLDLGTTQVYSTSEPLTGNGTYTASDTLPTTGTVAGTYTWSVTTAATATTIRLMTRAARPSRRWSARPARRL